MSILKMEIEENIDLESFCSEKNVLESIFRTKGIKFFIKDEKRRFVYANRAFLDFYGFESVADIKGCTDEDMGWHVDPVPFKQDELRVIEDGEVIEAAEGTCIIRGEIRNIRAYKIPIYDNDRIIGLVGYFYDFTEEVRMREHTELKIRRDPLTGLLNKEGLVEQLVIYESGYRRRGLNFCCICLNVDKFREIIAKHGEKYGEQLLRNIADCFSLTLSTGGIMARMYSDNFVILHQLAREDQVDIIISRLRLALNKVVALSDNELQLGVSVGTALMSEVEDSESLINLAEARMLEDKSNRQDKGVLTGMS